MADKVNLGQNNGGSLAKQGTSPESVASLLALLTLYRGVLQHANECRKVILLTRDLL